jgi:hypothetical protein
MKKMIKKKCTDIIVCHFFIFETMHFSEIWLAKTTGSDADIYLLVSIHKKKKNGREISP